MNLKEQIESEQYLQAKKQVKDIKGFYTHLLIYIVVNLTVSTVNMLWNHDITDRKTFFAALTHFSTYMNWIFWGIGLLIHGLNVFWLRSSFFKAWEARKVQEYMKEEAIEKGTYNE